MTDHNSSFVLDFILTLSSVTISVIFGVAFMGIFLSINGANYTDINKSKGKGRYFLLVFDCMLVVGIYFCTDMPSALQAQIEGTPTTNCTPSFNTTCCEDCIGMGADRYNLLYTIFSWTSSALILPVGFIIDRMGNRLSALVFTGIATSGSLVFAIASLPSIRGTSYMFPLMMCGRLLLGAGTGSSRIVRDRVIAAWFPDRLALAFGIAVSTMGIGSVLTFLLTQNLSRWVGLSTTLFVGAGVCSTCFMSAICLCIIDWYGRKYHSDVVVTLRGKAPFNCSSFKKLPISFVAICVMIASYYSFQLPFTANGTKFMQDKYGYAKTDSSYINGVLYDVSVVLSPFVGIILDMIGNRGWVAFLGAAATIPVGPLLLYTDMPPLVGYIWLGVAFTVTVVSLWSSIPHVVPHRLVGSANGIASCFLDMFVGLTSLAIGQIMSTTTVHEENDMTGEGWEGVFFIIFGQATICAVAGLLLNITCGRKEKKVNGKSSLRKKRKTSSIIGPVHCDNMSSSSSQEDIMEEPNKQAIFSINTDKMTAPLNDKSIIIENNTLIEWLKYQHNSGSYFDNIEKSKAGYLNINVDSNTNLNIPAIIVLLPESNTSPIFKEHIVNGSKHTGSVNKSFEEDNISVSTGNTLQGIDSNNICPPYSPDEMPSTDNTLYS